jgi:hypothetical protein
MKRSVVILILATIWSSALPAESNMPQKSPAEACASIDPQPGDDRDADFIRQIATVSAMRYMSQTAELAFEDGLEVSVETLAQEGLAKRAMCDGWGRPILVFGRGDTFLLVSYGRNGKPDGPRPTSRGGRDHASDYDEDIYIAGNKKDPWLPVQTPVDVDLY